MLHHCKIVCLIQLGQFEDALTSIKRFQTESNEFNFERAYCEYRLNQIENALKTLKSCQTMTYKEKELLAQVVIIIKKEIKLKPKLTP